MYYCIKITRKFHKVVGLNFYYSELKIVNNINFKSKSDIAFFDN